ncbi:MAG: site-specific integrase [Puia sp.]|nr:site-specific integrase [Puia sp.]
MKTTMIKSNLKRFEDYLAAKGHSKKTGASVVKGVRQFEKWAISQPFKKTVNATYSEILLYIKHCTTSGNAKKTVSLKLLFLRHYYEFLVKTGQATQNPVEGMQIQGVKRNILHNILSREELDKLYQVHKHPGLTGQRNKVIVGLFIFQGVRPEELALLQVSDIDLKSGKINIPGARRTNARTLDLQPAQIMEVWEYIQNTRPALLLQTSKTTEQLFISAGNGVNLPNTLQYFLSQLKALDKRITNLKQLRASVITAWLKVYNLRRAQYMAGHRYVSSTEKYKINDLDGLIEDITKYHPL